MKSKGKRVAMWSDVYRQYLKQGAGPERSEELAHDAVARAERNGVFDEPEERGGAWDPSDTLEAMKRMTDALNKVDIEVAMAEGDMSPVEQRRFWAADLAAWLVNDAITLRLDNKGYAVTKPKPEALDKILDSLGLARKVSAVRESPTALGAEPMKATDEGHGGSGASEAQRERIVNHVHAFPIPIQAKTTAEGDGGSDIASSYARVEYEPPYMAERRWREDIEKNLAAINETLAKPAIVPLHWHVALRAQTVTTNGAMNEPVLGPGHEVVLLTKHGREHAHTVTRHVADNGEIFFCVIASTPVYVGDTAAVCNPPAGISHNATVIAVH